MSRMVIEGLVPVIKLFIMSEPPGLNGRIKNTTARREETDPADSYSLIECREKAAGGVCVEL